MKRLGDTTNDLMRRSIVSEIDFRDGPERDSVVVKANRTFGCREE